ncbi:MAG: 4'-phosphopantetheinyl transferase superfamily protein [Crocinitomicaceae bacterium]|nr:4'-phosphopantetheinyl transferase superfamily protein [Crocinitomicaceae bacterium]
MHYKTQNIIENDNIRFSIILYADALPLYPEENLSKADLQKYNRAKSRKRKLEIFYSSILWKTFGIQEEIKYSGLGSPELKTGHLSKSHCSQQVGILVSKNAPFGIDLEAVDEKVHRVKNKFLHPDEEKRFETDKTINLIRIWSIKEATFKFLKLSGVTFKEMLCVTSLDENQGSIVVDHPDYRGVLAVKHWISQSNGMVYSLVGKPADISKL